MVHVHRPHEGASASRDEPETETAFPRREQPNVDDRLRYRTPFNDRFCVLQPL